jgi:hypothetical protein
MSSVHGNTVATQSTGQIKRQSRCIGFLHSIHELTPTRWYSRVRLVAMSPSPGVDDRSRSMQSMACYAASIGKAGASARLLGSSLG